MELTKRTFMRKIYLPIPALALAYALMAIIPLFGLGGTSLCYKPDMELSVCLASASTAMAQEQIPPVSPELGAPGVTLVPAPGRPPARPPFTAQLMQLIPMFTIVMVIYYLMVLRPKAAEEKGRTALMAGLGRGDSVMTAGGLVGKIMTRSGDTFQVEVAKGVVVQIHQDQVLSRYTPKVAPAGGAEVKKIDVK